jgi:hypothetical protein
MKTDALSLSSFRRRLESGGEAIVLLFEAAEEREWRWKPDADRWSLVEIANHLVDEETDDFRCRLRSVLEDPSRCWPPYDAFAGVASGTYAERDPQESVERFIRERSGSLTWLESVSSVNLNDRYAGPRAGHDGGRPALSVGDLMLSWLAHDYFHIRQITRLRWDYLNQLAPPHRSDYAGVE